ncbi:hypothetical protein B0H15DRAFT_495909 [Mycena belliarum]|uniref:Cytochrome c oxidase assembly protein COX20, mitochondrial n=1 Tax=Mycena belliarum TaxID=1033014 RepID=A0AAD6TWA7_9AGAR|nr:hypothetical protein B0H15DRAFT_495909 [Mycena belliae]
MSDPKTSTTPTSGLVDDPAKIPLPPRLGPPSTGNLIYDSVNSAIHIGEVPCGRNSLLHGIAGGVGIGFIRALSASPIVAGNFAMGTFAVVSIASWIMCENKIKRQQQLTRMAIQNLPKQLRLKKEGPDDKVPEST